jgi:ADP-L-glycero-D-manno-heptose 6-epimerase
MLVITGGAGFIGSNLVAALTARGRDDLVVVDRLGNGQKWRNLRKSPLSAIVPPEGMFEFLSDNRRGIDAVFHLGAISATTETDADLVVQTNFTLSQNLWRWCAKADVPLIYASSAATYGNGAAGFDDTATTSALARLRPLNTYGWSKHLFDQWVVRQLEHRLAAPPQWCGLKFFNVYGPNEYHKGQQQSLVAQIFPRAVAGEPARLYRSHHPDYPDGGQLRDFICVDDAVDMMIWLLGHPEICGIYNAGTGRARTWQDLAAAVFRAVDKEPLIAFIDMPEDIRATYQYVTEARMERLRQAGYGRSPTALEDGVRNYVQSFLRNSDPYR